MGTGQRGGVLGPFGSASRHLCAHVCGVHGVVLAQGSGFGQQIQGSDSTTWWTEGRGRAGRGPCQVAHQTGPQGPQKSPGEGQEEPCLPERGGQSCSR